MKERCGLEELRRLAEQSRLKADPAVNIDYFMLADEEYCRHPVMTISKADDGVVIDYAHDRTGEPVVIYEKPKCATEAFFNLFNWHGDPRIPHRMTYDELGQFLAARIKDYLSKGFSFRTPVQIAPKMDFFAPEDILK